MANAQEYRERMVMKAFLEGEVPVSEFDKKFRRESIAKNDIDVLEEKGKTYGDSWKKRGGVGAFMMLARKWDRIENQMQTNGYDIFKCNPDEKDGLLDDIQDLRRYLLLVEEEVLTRFDDDAKSSGSTFGVSFGETSLLKTTFDNSIIRSEAGVDPNRINMSFNNPYMNINQED